MTIILAFICLKVWPYLIIRFLQKNWCADFIASVERKEGKEKTGNNNPFKTLVNDSMNSVSERWVMSNKTSSLLCDYVFCTSILLITILKLIVDPAEIEKMVDKVLVENQKQLEQYRGGKTKLQGYFAGQVMKASKGKANPGLLNKILLEKLNAKS
ncbi:unnamed protein product, partial [Vitis vinifera]